MYLFRYNFYLTLVRLGLVKATFKIMRLKPVIDAILHSPVG